MNCCLPLQWMITDKIKVPNLRLLGMFCLPTCSFNTVDRIQKFQVEKRLEAGRINNLYFI
jgi:hypothetical protein